MAAVTAVLTALFRSAWRSLSGTRSFQGNNLVMVIALLMAEEPLDRPSSTAVIYLLVGLLWTLPMSQELTRRIPPARFRLWPLTRGEKATIHLGNLLLNPLVVIGLLFGLLSRDRSIGIALAVIGAVTPFLVLLAGVLVRHRPSWTPLQAIPRFPGRLGGLIQSHVRNLLQLLDFYFALFAAAGGIAYTRFSAKPDPEASVVFGHLVVILMSTCAQGHVSFDATATETRLRLMPLSKISILFARDMAWLIVTLPMILAFKPLACTAAALAALAIGHRASITPAVEQKRWSFSAGQLAPLGIVQLITLVAAGSAVYNYGWPAFALVVPGYLGSLWYWGRQ